MPDLMIPALTDGDPAQSTDLIPISRGTSNFYVTAETISSITVGAETTRAEAAEAANAAAIAAETARAEAEETTLQAAITALGTGGGGGGGGGGGMTQIAEVIVASAQATIEFSSIPQTYRNLKIFITSRETGTDGGMYLQFNSDTGANYQSDWLYSQDTSPSAARTSGWVSTTTIALTSLGTSPVATCAASGEITIYDYARTVWTKNAIGVSQRMDTSSYMFTAMLTWNNTAAITGIVLGANGGGSFVAGSVATLYGF